MQALYRKENRSNETIALEEILEKGKNAHGQVVYVEVRGGKREARYLDLPSRELVTLDEFKALKSHRAHENFRKFNGLKRGRKVRDCRSFLDEELDGDFLPCLRRQVTHGLGAT